MYTTCVLLYDPALICYFCFTKPLHFHVDMQLTCCNVDMQLTPKVSRYFISTLLFAVIFQHTIFKHTIINS